MASLTWLVQTLLNVTNAKVCASIVPARSFLASKIGIATNESKICGRKARLSTRSSEFDGCMELR